MEVDWQLEAAEEEGVGGGLAERVEVWEGGTEGGETEEEGLREEVVLVEGCWAAGGEDGRSEGGDQRVEKGIGNDGGEEVEALRLVGGTVGGGAIFGRGSALPAAAVDGG